MDTKYNDPIMMLYLMFAIYWMATNKPVIASIMVTMALGVKAGVYLIMPSFLGTIQYNHGISILLLSIIIIVVV